MPEFLTGQFPLSGDEPTYVLQAPPNKHMTGEVAFPGRLPVPLEFTTPEPGEEIVVPVRLMRAEELATLVIELETPPAEIPEVFSVLLWRAGLLDAPRTRSRSRSMRVSCAWRASSPRRTAFACAPVSTPIIQPDSSSSTSSISSSLLAGWSRGPSCWSSARGCASRCADEGGALVGGAFDFLNDQGGRAHLSMVVGEGQRRRGGYLEFYPYGTHESVNPLQPGRYRLDLVSPGYAKHSVTVELRTGAYADVDVTLSQ